MAATPPALRFASTDPTCVSGASAAGLAIVLAFLIPAAPLPRTLRRLHAVGCILIALALALITFSPIVSPYVLLISWTAFVQCAAFVLAPRLWTAVRYVARQWELSRRSPVAAAGVTAAVVLAAYGAVVAAHLRDHYGGNYSGFIQLSRARYDTVPWLKDRSDVRGTLYMLDNGGYDAQFMYYETYDPFLRAFRDRPSTYREYIDAPPYRYGRIGFPLLTKLFSADRWQWYPATMTLLILIALTACAFLLSLIGRASGGTAAWGLAILLVPGFWMSVHNALPEPIAAAFALAGYWCFLKQRLGWSGLMFALSLMVRETGAVFVVCLAGAVLIARGWKPSLRFATAALLPIVLWRLYVAWVLFPDAGAESLLYHPDDLGVPLGGFEDLWSHIARGDYHPEIPTMVRSGIAYPLLLGAAFVLAVSFAWKRPGPIAAAAVIYAGMAVSLKYGQIWSHIINGQRGTYEVFVALALLSVGVGTQPRVLRAALFAFWMGAAAYVLYAGFDAEYIRNAVFQGLL